MCGRFTISKQEEELEKRFGAKFYSKELERRYNIAPSHNSAVITNKDPEEIQLLRWGLIPFWAKDPKIGYKMINARAESVREKGAFKSAFVKRRCLVISDGFYEWIRSGNRKIPYRIQLKGGELFSFAGLWENWKSPDGDWIRSFTIVTTDAAPSIAHIHDRMPVILPKEEERLWLDEISEDDALSLLKPYPSDGLSFYTVSTQVNSPDNETPELVEEVEYPADRDLFSS